MKEKIKYILIIVLTSIVLVGCGSRQPTEKLAAIEDNVVSVVPRAKKEIDTTKASKEKHKKKHKKKIKWNSIGKFKITFYCPCKKCCGHSAGITSSGKRAKTGRTIGVDQSVIPIGSKIKIGNHIYIAEDTGVHGKVIDVFMNSHGAALKNGVQYRNVKILKGRKKHG